MYLNKLAIVASEKTSSFNYNMGCIWISLRIWQFHWAFRLTITWDVFECHPGCLFHLIWSCLTITWDVFEWSIVPNPRRAAGFNYNMGCIWIYRSNVIFWCHSEFNYNMGCIWMYLLKKLGRKAAGLTITWDVFESNKRGKGIFF